MIITFEAEYSGRSRKEGDHYEVLDIENYDGMAWTGLIWLVMWTNDLLC
jgi:hypothetical protein